MEYDLVIGLETHVELSTKSKIFCSCTTEFGAEANTHCCPVCLGLPGAIPHLNRQAVQFIVKAGLATDCKIANYSKMDRKNYIYPDLSKAYQVSQFDVPFCENGVIELDSGKKIRIERIHLEEDAGKLIHQGNEILVDYNRGGVPLIEIVTKPDFSTKEEVREYLEKLQLIMKYIDVSDCKMQEGSMRCDVNISVKKKDSNKLGVRAEIKNMNSFSFIEKAIAYEERRQINALENNETLLQETRRYNEEKNCTESMRTKENAEDYRYFRDPDIPAVYLSKAFIEMTQNSLGVLPSSRYKTYTETYQIPPSDAMQIIKYRAMGDYFEKAIEGISQPKMISNFIIGQIFANVSSEEAREKAEIPVSSKDLNTLVQLLEKKTIQMNFAKQILDTMLNTKKALKDLVKESDFIQLTKDDLLVYCTEAIEKNERAVSDYLNGKDRALKALIGFVMKQTKGKADATQCEAMLIDLLKKESL